MIRLLFLFAAMLWPALPAPGIDDQVFFSSPSKVGALTLEAGSYKLKIQGSIVFFTQPKSGKTASTVAKVEKTVKRSAFTAAQGPLADGVQRIDRIVLQGADYQLVFGN